MPHRKMPTPSTERCLRVAILGMPNSGKSTLLNCLIRTRLAACTQKAHTTRSQILGVYNHKNIQLAFTDTPGFVSFSDSLKKDTKILRGLAIEAASQTDIVILLVDAAKNLSPGVLQTFTDMAKLALDESRMEVILVLNKVDLLDEKFILLDVTRTLVSLINGIKLGADKAHEAVLDTTTFMISAIENDGVIDLKNYLLSLAPHRNWIIPKEKGATDLTNEERVQEMLLEKLMIHTHAEVPYIAGIKCVAISSENADTLKVDVDIFVNSNAQQRIVVGEKGRTLVKIRQVIMI